MFDFFQGIIDGIVTVVTFIVDLIKDIVEMVRLVAEAMIKIPEYLAQFLPPQVITSILVIFGVVVIYKIIGREG